MQILAAVQRGHGAIGDRPKQRKMELVDVEMQDVEFIRLLAHPVEHQHVVGNRVADIGVEPQRHRYARHQFGAGDRIAAGEQRHIVTQPDQLVGEIGDNSLAFPHKAAAARSP